MAPAVMQEQEVLWRLLGGATTCTISMGQAKTSQMASSRLIARTRHYQTPHKQHHCMRTAGSIFKHMTKRQDEGRPRPRTCTHAHCKIGIACLQSVLVRACDTQQAMLDSVSLLHLVHRHAQTSGRLCNLYSFIGVYR
jgi:hypothetical protein